MALDFGKLNFAVSFNPSSAFPLDARSYFESLEDAQAAAASAKPVGDSTTVYYFGQTVCVVDTAAESASAKLYIITPVQDGENVVGSLAEVGSKIEIDESEFAFVDGKLDLLGFAGAVEGAQLLKQDGKLAWVKPDATTVEGLQTTVTNLSTIVNGEKGVEGSGLVNRMAAVEGKADKNASDIVAINSSLADKANSADVYTKTEADAAISGAVSSAGHLKRAVVEALPEVAEADADTIYMIKVGDAEGKDNYEEYMLINEALVKIGDTSVDLTPYAKTEDLASKADSSVVEELSGTVATHTTNISDLSGRIGTAEGSITSLQAAVGDKADSSSLAEYLKKDEASQAYVTGNSLATQLNSYLTTEAANAKYVAKAGYVAYSEAEKSKLANISDGANANIIESISIAGTDAVVTDKKVAIPVASEDAYGVVKTSAEVGTADDGSLEVKSLNINKLSQTDGDLLVLNANN